MVGGILRSTDLGELVVLVAIGGGETSFVPGNHLRVVKVLAGISVHGFGSEEPVGHVQILVPRQQRVVVQLVTVPLPFHIL